MTSNVKFWDTMRKIHCEEITKEGFDNKDFTKQELREMVGFIDPPSNGENWTVTMFDGCYFDCKTQEIAQLMASMEEIKALMLKD